MNTLEQNQASKDTPHSFTLAGTYRLFGTESFLVWGLASVAWGLMLIATLTGQRHLLVHGALMVDDTVPWVLKLILFFVAWQVMMIAMMLPTTLPMVQIFVNESVGQSYTRLKLLIS